MGAMKDFVIWCEEKGFAEWNDFTDQYDYNIDPNSKEIWDEYMLESWIKKENEITDG